jgi:hypothetical protein
VEGSHEDKWVPLGVFAMVRNEPQHPQLILSNLTESEATALLHKAGKTDLDLPRLQQPK